MPLMEAPLTAPLSRIHSLALLVGSRLDSIVNTLTGLGGLGDKGQAGTVAGKGYLSTAALETLYECNGYAARIIDKPAEDATGKGWRIDDGTTRNSDPMARVDKTLQVRTRMGEALKQARLKGGALVVMVTDEDTAGFSRAEGGDPKDLLALPLKPETVNEIVNLAIFTREDATACQWTSNIRDANYRKPELWQVTAPAEALGALEEGEENLVKPGTSFKIHHSRVLYIPGKKTSARRRYRRNGWDLSVLDGFFDQIRNITTTEQSLAVLIQELKLDILKIKGLEKLTNSEQCEYFEERLEILAKSKSVGGVILLDADEEYVVQNASLAGVGEVHATYRFALAAVTGLPQVVLFGDTPGGLNSDGDSHRTLHQSAISAIQEHVLDEPLTQLYTVIYASKKGPTKGVIPEDWEIKYNPIWKMSDKDQADLEKVHAESDKIRIESEVILPEHATASRHSDEGYQNQLLPVDLEAMEAAKEEDVLAMQEELEAMRAQGPPQGAPTDLDDGEEAEEPQKGRTDALQRRLDFMATLNPQMLKVLAIPGVADLLTSLIGENPASRAVSLVQEEANRQIGDLFEKLEEERAARIALENTLTTLLERLGADNGNGTRTDKTAETGPKTPSSEGSGTTLPSDDDQASQHTDSTDPKGTIPPDQSGPT